MRILLPLLLLTLPVTVGAQDSSSFVPLQMRVRVSTVVFGSEPLDLVGKLASLSHDSVVVLRAADATRIAAPIAALRRFELSQGFQSHRRKGLLYGLAGGVVGGAGSALLLVCGERRCQGDGDWRAQYAFALGVGGGLVGAGIGALVGSMIRTERWQEIPLPSLRIGVRR